MALAAVHALVALLACLCLSTEALPSQPVFSQYGNVRFHVPEGKLHDYKYSAEVKTGQNEPTPYASKLQIQGKLAHAQYPPEDNNDLMDYFKFHDVEHKIHNGPDDIESPGAYVPLSNANKYLQEPFVFLHDKFTNLQFLQLKKEDHSWSKNIKISLALLMQVDVDLESLKKARGPLYYEVTEKTIHGNCLVRYYINATVDPLKGANKLYHLRKHYEPRTCSDYVQSVVSDADSMHCGAKTEEDLVTSAEKTYEFELVNDKFLLKKLVSHEKFSYLPYLHRSAGIQYIETYQKFELEGESSSPEFPVEFARFENSTLLALVFGSSFVSYGETGANVNDAVKTVEKMLVTMVDRLRENQINATTDPEHAGLLLDLQRVIENLDADAMDKIYAKFNFSTEKDTLIRIIFLKVVSQVGTRAAWDFMKVVASNDMFPDESTAIDVLNNLPMFILNPNEEFAKSMVQFRNLHLTPVSKKIVNAGILCYSVLLHKTYQDVGSYVPEYLQKELEYFLDRIKHEPTYESKIVYIMAMKNVKVGNIYSYLRGIIDGTSVISPVENDNKDYNAKYRKAAMWAVMDAISSEEKRAFYDQIWTIFSNSSESMPLRLTAYEILVSRNRKLDMNLLMKIHWFMSEEQDEHVFSYHYMTLKNMAESTDPCMAEVSELARKTLRLTQRRKVFSSVLSTVSVFDYYDNKYGHGKTFKVAAGINEGSGIPQFGYYELITKDVKSKFEKGIYWDIDGFNLNMVVSLVQSLVLEQDAASEQAPYEILDQEVRNLLKQTHGHKLLDKNVHVEYWLVSKGYVTNVEVITETGLSNYLKDYVNDYKPRNMMDVKEKFNQIYFHVSSYNDYKMVVPTDIGIPCIFRNRSPYLLYAKLKPSIHPLQTIIAMKLEFEAKIFYHNRYEIEFVNPFADVVQSVRREVTADFSLPIDLTVNLNLKTLGWKVVLPRLPETRLSVAGLKTYTHDVVKVSNDVTGNLKNVFPQIEHEVQITEGPSHKKNFESVIHSKETGLEYSFSIYDCEGYRAPKVDYEEIFRVFATKENNLNSEVWPSMLMKMDQELFSFVHAPYAHTCGKILKIAPSTLYPTSHVEMNWHVPQAKNLDGKINLRLEGSVDTKVANANETGSHWDVKLALEVTPLMDDLKLLVTKRMPEEKNYKICLAARKLYPDVLMKMIKKKHGTDTKIMFNAGYTNSDHCIFDDSATEVTIAMKGELLDEQLEHMQKYVKPGSCFKNPFNPLDLDVTQRFDWNCLYEAVKGTTMRNYTIDVTYKNIPQEVLAKLIVVDDFIRHDSRKYLSYNSNHTELGNVKIFVTYGMNDNYANITVMNPYFTYQLTDIEYGCSKPTDGKNDVILDNIEFRTNFLIDFYKGEMRPCIAHAHDLINDLNQTIPMEFNEWTLLSGDHELMTYAVFVKAVQNKVAVKIFSSMHVLEIQPAGDLPIVTLNGNEVVTSQIFEEELLLPKSTECGSYFKLTMVNEIMSIELQKTSEIMIFYTPYNAVVFPHIILDRNIDGVCGHLGSTSYVQQVPLVYGN